MPTPTQRVLCQICQKPQRVTNVVPAELVRPPVVDAIVKVHPEWSSDGFICLADLNHFRGEYFEDLMAADKGELSTLEQEVITSLQQEQELLSTNINLEIDRHLTVGERIADKVAEFGGSWSFIGAFGVVLLVWIVINSIRLLDHPFDPYPYILLNLVLSCVAALQAPVIMMSQNRQEARDRVRAEHEYRVNLKAEIEIRHIIGGNRTKVHKVSQPRPIGRGRGRRLLGSGCSAVEQAWQGPL